MKPKHTIAAAVAALSLGIATAASAHPGETGGREGSHAHGGMHHGMKGGMEHGAMHGHAEGRGHGAQPMTQEERTAFHEKMRNASPEERRTLAQSMRAEMQKRAQERGVTPHEHRGPRHGGGAAQSPAAPAQAQ